MASRKEALGRGLSAILGSDGDLTPQEAVRQGKRLRAAGRVADVDISLVRPNPYQPRNDFNEETLKELAESIRQLGVIQPITVRATGGGFEVISGERRLRAARQAGLERIPAYVREADSGKMLHMAIVENIQRDALNPIEVALAYRRLMEECGLTHEGVAEQVAKSRTTVTNFLRLLKLPPRIQAGLRDGLVSIGHARALINIPSEHDRIRLFDEILQKRLSVREVEKRVRRYVNRHSEPPRREHEPSTKPGERDREDRGRDPYEITAFTTRLRNHLSTQVRIRHRSDGGRIEIDYYSNDDLERLLELLTRK